ncbi:MAG: YigZ family protein [Eubacteriales bacterium]|nr:YigZ family protein [Eubacteriales bacterium]
MNDQLPERYRTLSREGTCEFTEKKSRFIGWAAPALSETDAQAYIAQVTARYPDCSAVLYGYISGYFNNIHRFYDSHEPQGGLQILEALKKREVTGAAAVVVRYYGGIQLGAGPLGRAFGRAAAQAAQDALPAEVEQTLHYRVQFPYELSGKLEYFFEHSPYLLENLTYAEAVTACVLVRRSDQTAFAADMAALTAGKARPEQTGQSYRAWP